MKVEGYKLNQIFESMAVTAISISIGMPFLMMCLIFIGYDVKNFTPLIVLICVLNILFFIFMWLSEKVLK